MTYTTAILKSYRDYLKKYKYFILSAVTSVFEKSLQRQLRQNIRNKRKEEPMFARTAFDKHYF